MSAAGEPAPDPSPDLECCFNCRHMLWMVGIGQGAKCAHPANERDGTKLEIPSRLYVCSLFARRPAPSVDRD